MNDRVGQTVAGNTTDFALDIAGGLPEVIYTSEGDAYLHLPGVIVAESSTGETRYLLSDGLGSVRQATDDTGSVVAYNEFDPYGTPTLNAEPGTENYGFTGEWWNSYIKLLHLRARWYAPESATFLSVDPVESEPPYQYVRGNPVNRVDPSGFAPTKEEAGTKYVYSCNCGWIDWSHAGVRSGEIQKVLDVQTGQNGWGLTNLQHRNSTRATLGSIQIGEQNIDIPIPFATGGFEGTIAISTDLQGFERSEVALGIFISASNLFENSQATQWYQFSNRVNDSSFSEEDLMSNLIGFYRGLYQIARGTPLSQQEIMRICNVVGMDEPNFEEIQKGIWDEYDKPFWRIHTWGQPRLDGWDGFIDEDCSTRACERPRRIPNFFLTLQPQPPSTDNNSRGWRWVQGNNFNAINAHGGISRIVHEYETFQASELNHAPLNWHP